MNKLNNTVRTRSNIDHIKSNIKSKLKALKALRQTDIDNGVRVGPITPAEIHIALSEVILGELNDTLSSEQLEEVIQEAQKAVKPPSDPNITSTEEQIELLEGE